MCVVSLLVSALTISDVMWVYPFMILFFKKLGLTTTECSIIYGFLPIFNSVFNLLAGAIADKLQLHRQLALLSAILCTILFKCLLLVPRLDQHTKGITLGLNSTCIKLQNSSVQCSLNNFGHSIIFVDDMNTLEEFVKNKNFADCPLTWNKHICLQILEMNTGVNQRKHYFDSSFEACTCKLNCSENHFKTSEKGGQMYGKTFWMSFFLFVSAMNLFNLVWILLLGMTFAVLGEKRNDFGKQTLWGSIGAITTSVISAITMN